METEPIKRVQENAAGDFYSAADRCLRCCLPHGEAPELMNDSKSDFRECYFRRQPQTPEEIEHAVRAVWVSELSALRYGGSDQGIIRRLHELGCGHCCDQPLLEEPVSASHARVDAVAQAGATAGTNWWRRLFGWRK